MTDDQNKILNSKMTIPNLAALGAWHNVKSYNISKVASGAFSGFITSGTRDDALIYGVSGVAVFHLFLKDRQTTDNLI